MASDEDFEHVTVEDSSVKVTSLEEKVIGTETKKNSVSFFAPLSGGNSEKKTAKVAPVLSTQKQITVIPKSEVYVILLDGVPKFYAESHIIASKKAVQCLEYLGKKSGKTFKIFIEKNDVFRLCSINTYVFINFECTEHVVRIKAIPRVIFPETTN
jgi:hypothetical protein